MTRRHDVTDATAMREPSVTVTIRYFAGARAAAGTGEESLSLPATATVGALVEALTLRHGTGLARVLASASFLVDELASERDRILPAEATVDVLPPFAGG